MLIASPTWKTAIFNEFLWESLTLTKPPLAHFSRLPALDLYNNPVRVPAMTDLASSSLSKAEKIIWLTRGPGNSDEERTYSQSGVVQAGVLWDNNVMSVWYHNHTITSGWECWIDNKQEKIVARQIVWIRQGKGRLLKIKKKYIFHLLSVDPSKCFG